MKKGKSVFVAGEDRDASDEAYVVHSVFQTDSTKGLMTETAGLALSDACCAKTVCGHRWMQNRLKLLGDLEMPYVILPDKQPFRCGGGPKLYSRYAAVLPMFTKRAKRIILL